MMGLRPRRRVDLALWTLLACGLVTACGDAATTETTFPVDLPVMTLSGPMLEIGAIDGAEEYLFASIANAIRLPDGSIAVSDPGNTRISVYDAEGMHVRSFGSQGEGPGEFRSLSRIYAKGDSVLAADQRIGTVSAFDLEGTLGGQRPAVDLSGDSTFSLDTWLYGRFWVDGALHADERARVRAALDRLPQPRSAPGYRYVRVTRAGDLWVREPGVSVDGVRTWTRVAPSGQPNAIIQAPGAFDPMDIGSDEVVGRWTGEADVSFVRVYELADASSLRPVPAWLVPTADDAPAADGPDEEEVRALVVSVIKNVASAQEIHYASNMSYTTDMAVLTQTMESRSSAGRRQVETPEELEIDILSADSRGWTGVFTHPGFDRLCGLAYGFNMPPGWVPGMVVCAPATGATNADGGN